MNIFDKKLLLFGGKGGVGKTTCAAATALYASSKGKKTLILSTDPAHSLSDSYEIKIGDKITKINDKLDAIEIESETLLDKFKKENIELIKQIANEGTFFSKEDIQEFFDLSLPGMDELMALFKINEIILSKDYDLLILDTAPTGHTIRLLELPDILTSYSNLLMSMRQKHKVIVTMMTRSKYIKDKADLFIDKLNNNIKNLKKVLNDSSTLFIPVMIPEKLSILESERLIKFLKKSNIKVKFIIVNRVIRKNCPFCDLRQINQEEYLLDIKNKFKEYAILKIPLFDDEIKGNSLDYVSNSLFENKKIMPSTQKKSSAIYDNKISFKKLSFNSTFQFILFGGKGGVGKTSCAAACALKESEKRKVLIFSTDPAHSLSDIFNVNIGNKVTKIKENLFALEIDAFSNLKDLKSKYKKEIQSFFTSAFKSSNRATIDAPYDRKVMENLFDLAPPGIDEIMALKLMMDQLEKKEYDLFILDTAPTGHTIRLLEMPEIAEKWVATISEILEKYPISFETGKTLQEMLNTIRKIRSILKNKLKSEFVIVSIPEAMSVMETNDLIESLNKLAVPLSHIIINKITPNSECLFCKSKRNNQIPYITQLTDLNLKPIGVNLQEKEIKGLDSLEKLKDILY